MYEEGSYSLQVLKALKEFDEKNICKRRPSKQPQNSASLCKMVLPGLIPKKIQVIKGETSEESNEALNRHSPNPKL